MCAVSKDTPHRDMHHSEESRSIKVGSLYASLHLMLRQRNSPISRLLDKIPGKQLFGPYRFMPIFFFAGAALEFSMIHWAVGETNFYKTYKKRVVRETAERELMLEEMKELQR
ncbi:small integral membrane protein-like [Tropilaelaps mercedesae]|uniref:Small integral membrane protein-like n=1 Tax=Tropilaelaps mercedesae TaxID=418985 RepID=A0A1V9XHC3_9ACAR|nr:small integral membrane protein-like [Tropilaelaps mercedesae]